MAIKSVKRVGPHWWSRSGGVAEYVRIERRLTGAERCHKIPGDAVD